MEHPRPVSFETLPAEIIAAISETLAPERDLDSLRSFSETSSTNREVALRVAKDRGLDRLQKYLRGLRITYSFDSTTVRSDLNSCVILGDGAMIESYLAGKYPQVVIVVGTGRDTINYFWNGLDESSGVVDTAFELSCREASGKSTRRMSAVKFVESDEKFTFRETRCIVDGWSILIPKFEGSSEIEKIANQKLGIVRDVILKLCLQKE